MELIAFRVTMYKGILDSGWIEVAPLTVFVGKNEAGKTSLLRALNKLNSDPVDLYDMTKEWPRAHWEKRDINYIVCRAKFQLSDKEKSDLAKITKREIFPDIVEVFVNYDTDPEINFGEDILSGRFFPQNIENAFDALPEIQDKFNDRFKRIAHKCFEEVRQLASEGQLSELEKLPEKHQQPLREVVSESLQQIEGHFIDEYYTSLPRFVERLRALSFSRINVYDYIMECLPRFIYIDDYTAFDGTAQLDEVQARRDNNNLTKEDRTFLKILDLSDLDLDELVQLAQSDIKGSKKLQYNLDVGAATLTKKVMRHFHQRRYEVQYRTNGQHFFTFIIDDHDPSLIELKERSKGFQWYFSFDMTFMYESEGTFKNCVLLLDEPGLHLHPNAQKDLLRRLEHYAKENTLLYTTHLPFMIDLNQPDRIRVLKETDNGIVVTTDLIDSPPEAKFVLQAALGMDASQSFLVAKRNLVVEGVDDYLVLTALSNLLQEDGAEGLPEDVHITPGGGASEAVRIASFMIGQKLDVVVLFDSDKAGKDAKDKLEKEWLTRYTESKTKVILLGCAVGVCREFALEDLFPDDFITDIVQEFYSEDLERVGVNEIVLQGNNMLWHRIKHFMGGIGIEINKGPIAKRLGWKISGMKDASELPCGTRDKAIKLFQKIRSALGDESPQSS